MLCSHPDGTLHVGSFIPEPQHSQDGDANEQRLHKSCIVDEDVNVTCDQHQQSHKALEIATKEPALNPQNALCIDTR